MPVTIEDVLDKIHELEQRIESLENHVLTLVADMIERKGGK